MLARVTWLARLVVSIEMALVMAAQVVQVVRPAVAVEEHVRVSAQR